MIGPAGPDSIIAAMNVELETLPRAIYTTEQVRSIDRIAIEEHGIAGYKLMSRAGRASLDLLLRRWPDARSLVIFCGAGNNAGDGYVLARLAHERGIRVQVLTTIDTHGLRGDADTAFTQAAEHDIEAVRFNARRHRAILSEADVVVDALLGTGLARDVEGVFAEAIAAINASGRPVLALDVPSGLDGDTGVPRGSAVRADATITFVGLKQGLFLGQAPDFRGELVYSSLGVPRSARADLVPSMRRSTRGELEQYLKPRQRTAHKGLNGRVLLVGGAPGMSGAVRLAAEAALRAGAGLVHVATHPQSVAAVMAGRPEIMCRGVERVEDLGEWLEGADVLVLGPGLGQGPWGRGLFEGLIGAECPLVLDADGLNLLSERAFGRERWVLTPHPGEAARLLGRSAHDVQADRLRAVRDLVARYGAVALLKGACSLVAQPPESDTIPVSVCDRGNPGMATAGMGDVLAGVTGALIAQRLALGAAVELAALVHALAGDDAARDGERGMIASDLLPFIRARVNPEPRGSARPDAGRTDSGAPGRGGARDGADAL